MKKVLIVAAIGLFAGSLASCKKDYVCECRINGETEVDNYLNILDSKEDDAKAICDNYAFSDETCTLEEK